MAETLELLWVCTGIVFFVANLIIMMIRSAYQYSYHKNIKSRFLDLDSKIPYYDSVSRSKLFFKVFDRFLRLKIFSVGSSRAYFDDVFGLRIIKKTGDAVLTNNHKRTVFWWIVSDFAKGLLFMYIILSIPMVLFLA